MAKLNMVQAINLALKQEMEARYGHPLTETIGEIAKKVGGHGVGLGDEAVHRGQPVAGEGGVHPPRLVGDDVVQEVAGADPGALQAADDGAVGGGEERHPVLEHHQVGLQLPDAARGPEPGQGIDGVDEPLRVHPDRLRTRSRPFQVI